MQFAGNLKLWPRERDSNQALEPQTKNFQLTDGGPPEALDSAQLDAPSNSGRSFSRPQGEQSVKGVVQLLALTAAIITGSIHLL